MELIIIQTYGSKNKFNQIKDGNSVKIIPSVEQKMAEYQAFCSSEQTTEEEEEIQLKLKMREVIEEGNKIEKLIENNTNNYLQQGRQLLLKHSELRPVTFTDINMFESTIRLSTQFWYGEVRDAVCSYLLLLRALNVGKRKKRQNFSDRVTCILNNYFVNHLNKPYPDETTKIALAKECGITLAQVSNWFGNKRIRYRKAQIKALKNKKEAEKDENNK
ncbi:Homeobox domain-containing protein [Meloidogyne graminicola]|uniref:Homeobox domain-containing protein n=1 Tax=Meloidogyne graminicola TaxID=189291 RepID=A0A8S9ZL27_9BILA|nr:Homeobox domain-containing protein [Meloidogyne graminicola]